MPTPPIVLSATETARRSHAWAESTSCRAGGRGVGPRGVLLITMRRLLGRVLVLTSAPHCSPAGSQKGGFQAGLSGKPGAIGDMLIASEARRLQRRRRSGEALAPWER